MLPYLNLLDFVHIYIFHKLQIKKDLSKLIDIIESILLKNKNRLKLTTHYYEPDNEVSIQITCLENISEIVANIPGFQDCSESI